MAIMSQLTKRIKVYSTDCNQIAYIFNAIQDLKLDMTVSVGVWIDDSLATSFRQIRTLCELLRLFPHHYINSIIVGNDVLFREDVSTEKLISFIEYIKSYLRKSGIKDVPVGTSEIGSKWSHDLAKHVDLLAANIQPFYGGVDVQNSTKWTYDFLLRQVAGRVNPANVIYVISEVGWPSGGGSLQEAVAGEKELQTFLDNWLCTNQDTDVGWYWYEAFDQPWKSKWNTIDSQWDSQWGLFTADRKLKNITIPQCTQTSN